MQKWEYLWVSTSVAKDQKYTALRPRWVNDQELPDWENVTLFEYSTMRGQEGWELVGMAHSGGFVFTQCFKRPIED